MTHTTAQIEALEYLTEVYTDNDYLEDCEWTFQDFLSDIQSCGDEEDYSETVRNYAKEINYTA